MSQMPTNDDLAIQYLVNRLTEERAKWTAVSAAWTQALHSTVEAIRSRGVEGIPPWSKVEAR